MTQSITIEARTLVNNKGETITVSLHTYFVILLYSHIHWSVKARDISGVPHTIILNQQNFKNQ